MSSTFSQADESHMRRALRLAARGEGRVEPNPMVGCVLVRKGRVVGEGWHRQFGGPHAEINALKTAGAKARGATAYVTLEPCCHHGKTPPCTGALIDAGVARVVAGMRDPFAKVRGKGFRQLISAGIEVSVGLCEEEAFTLTAPYIKRQCIGQPWVILKWAQSIDGRIATHTGDSKWISGERSRKRAHELRARADAIIDGVGTVLADDPDLTCRHVRPKRTAVRVVLDRNLRTPQRSRVVRSAKQTPTLIVVGRSVIRSRKADAFRNQGVELMMVRTTRNGFDLSALLKALGSRGMTNVMVEGGGQTLGAFWDAGAADEALVFVAPKLIGGEDAVPALKGLGLSTLQDRSAPRSARITRSGDDQVYELLF